MLRRRISYKINFKIKALLLLIWMSIIVDGYKHKSCLIKPQPKICNKSDVFFFVLPTFNRSQYIPEPTPRWQSILWQFIISLGLVVTIIFAVIFWDHGIYFITCKDRVVYLPWDDKRTFILQRVCQPCQKNFWRTYDPPEVDLYFYCSDCIFRNGNGNGNRNGRANRRNRRNQQLQLQQPRESGLLGRKVNNFIVIFFIILIASVTTYIMQAADWTTVVDDMLSPPDKLAFKKPKKRGEF